MKVADKIPNPRLIRHCILKNLILHSIMNSRVIDNTDHLNTLSEKITFVEGSKRIYRSKHLGFLHPQFL